MPNASPIEIASFAVAFAALCGLTASLWASIRLHEGREAYIGQLLLMVVAAVFAGNSAIAMSVPTSHSTLSILANAIRIIGTLCVLVKAGIESNSHINRGDA